MAIVDGYITLDIPAFRAAFPAFADNVLYPDTMLEIQWDIATCYVTDRACSCVRPDGSSCQQTALWLMLAHLLQLVTLATGGGSGGAGGIVKSATIDKVSVTVEAPPISGAWDWWLNQTPYGAQLLALLSARASGGFYVGGLPEPTAFRKWGGIFGGYGGGGNGC